MNREQLTRNEQKLISLLKSKGLYQALLEHYGSDKVLCIEMARALPKFIKAFNPARLEKRHLN